MTFSISSVSPENAQQYSIQLYQLYTSLAQALHVLYKLITYKYVGCNSHFCHLQPLKTFYALINREKPTDRFALTRVFPEPSDRNTLCAPCTKPQAAPTTPTTVSSTWSTWSCASPSRTPAAGTCPSTSPHPLGPSLSCWPTGNMKGNIQDIMKHTEALCIHEL